MQDWQHCSCRWLLQAAVLLLLPLLLLLAAAQKQRYCCECGSQLAPGLLCLVSEVRVQGLLFQAAAAAAAAAAKWTLDGSMLWRIACITSCQ
jgi:hypothetical protein